MNKYRIAPYDICSNIHLIQKQTLFFFWRTIGIGTEAECKKGIEKLEQKTS